MTRPQPNEFATYYSRYIDLINGDEIVSILKSQLEETNKFLATISEDRSLKSYAPDKWTIRQVQSHVNDGERVFLSRAFWFARGFPEALPGFDQDVSVQAAGANDVPWENLKNEFCDIRRSTISFFENLPKDAWMRIGVASGYPFTVNALAYIIAGHVTHHRNVLRERYL
jgi:DinB superfamily